MRPSGQLDAPRAQLGRWRRLQSIGRASLGLALPKELATGAIVQVAGLVRDWPALITRPHGKKSRQVSRNEGPKFDTHPAGRLSPSVALSCPPFSPLGPARKAV